MGIALSNFSSLQQAIMTPAAFVEDGLTQGVKQNIAGGGFLRVGDQLGGFVLSFMSSAFLSHGNDHE
jgi:hypothetical protein